MAFQSFELSFSPVLPELREQGIIADLVAEWSTGKAGNETKAAITTIELETAAYYDNTFEYWPTRTTATGRPGG